MDYKESLSYLESLNVFGSKLGLSRIERLTELLGHPERRYRTVHVTGTNGKGSVSAMTAAILTESGFRTGLYTSPHLTSYTERFVIDGEQASEEDFAAAISAAKEAAEAMLAEGLEQPTEFEVLTAAAFYYFAEKDVDYAVIEVGLGGLLDSTNVIMPEVAVITNVAMEHADRCGGTLEGVAHHKAGIIKRGVPVVTAMSCAERPRRRKAKSSPMAKISARPQVLRESTSRRRTAAQRTTRSRLAAHTSGRTPRSPFGRRCSSPRSIAPSRTRQSPAP